MQPLENKFGCLLNLPSMPVLLMDAIQQINEKPNLTTLVATISQDPAMVIRVLRIANSPFYGMFREIGSLREAIVLLGLNRIRDMLISISFSEILPTWHKDFNYRQFWRHSMAVAECSRQLAALSGNNPDFAFTAGLLHDIGFLVIAILFPDEFSRIINETAYPRIETIRQILGFDNVEIGGKAAQCWNLPVVIQEAIEQHETPPGINTTQSLGLLVYSANFLIKKAEQPVESALEEHAPLCAALAILNVSIEQAARCTANGQQFADQILSLA